MAPFPDASVACQLAIWQWPSSALAMTAIEEVEILVRRAEINPQPRPSCPREWLLWVTQDGAEQPPPLAPNELAIKYPSRDKDGLYPLAIGVLRRTEHHSRVNLSATFDISSASDAKWDDMKLRTKQTGAAFTVQLNSCVDATMPTSVVTLVALDLELFDIPLRDKSRELIRIKGRLRAEVDAKMNYEKEKKKMSSERRSKMATNALSELVRYLNVQSAV
ncbi:hypothetical protein M427DRAFT_50331 [Gonapodya prolifera JEL478]|uniref:Uncharacterized protein n=1 Tax=Gonapodya prolifera (strain JEL478) TaxID=1344416 RepID=A0A138ZWB2_GONPJ|nr:hypothetical protein M427DRAFT_50331 [Gonapodya prolifera JEL478]|eukprot:KXS08776.1 hypothetical protein M427DRAFT_50331 [Gonapodya prolifera JEL478]